MFSKITKGIFGKKDILKHVTLDGVRIHLNTRERKLWINNFYELRLNEPATCILEAFIDSCYEVQKENVINHTVGKLSKHYKKDKEILNEDLEQLIGIINKFAGNEIPTNLVGVTNVSDKERTAPNRMDISLTYKCNNKCPHCYLPSNKDPSKVLTIEEWQKVIDKLWTIGIPQIVFTGGECTLKGDMLVELVAYARKFVTGIITNGTLITEKMAKNLAKAELDWIQITLDSDQEGIHDKMQGREGAFKETIEGIKNCVKVGINTNVNMTLTKKNFQDLKWVINLAKSLGVNVATTNALINSGRGKDVKQDDGIPENELKPILENAKKYAEEKGIGFNWFLPTCYNNFNPVETGFGQRCCSACSINMMIEPDGQLIPCQSWTHQKLGNILTDRWSKIWNNSLAVRIRNHQFADKVCKGCKYFDKCLGSCPLDKTYMRCKAG